MLGSLSQYLLSMTAVDFTSSFQPSSPQSLSGFKLWKINLKALIIPYKIEVMLLLGSTKIIREWTKENTHRKDLLILPARRQCGCDRQDS
jgi:hypothetical protein